MMGGIRRLLELLNAEPLWTESIEVSYRDLWRLFHRYFLVRNWPSLLVAALLAVFASVQPYVYAWAGRVLADDVVQVQYLTADRPAAESLDPARPGEHRRFAFDEGGDHRTLGQRLQQRPGLTIREKMQRLGWLALGLALFMGTIYISQFVRAERVIKIGLDAQFQMRRRLHEKMMVLPQTYHDRHSAGELLTHLFSDVVHLQNFGLKLGIGVLIDVVTMAVGLGIVYAIDARLATLVVVALPAYAICYRWFRRRLRVVNRNLREREGRLNAHIANRVRHFLLVKSYVRENAEGLDFLRKARPLLRDNLSATLLGGAFSAMCAVITGVSIHAVLWLGALQVQDGQMTLGTLLLFYASSATLFGPVTALTNKAGAMHRMRAVSARVIRLLDEPISITDPADPRPLPEAAPQIRFEHVTMQYQSDREPALVDLSFVLPAGKRLCVMGKSGSGRTTLAKIVCRLYDPTEGAVLLDGVDLRHFRLTDLRRLIGFVPQEPIIFSGSIEENIRYGSEWADPTSVVDAARNAQIHEFIQGLPRRYGTLTYERGLTLSGGQKQRVNLARALLHDPKVLVLDDCTSALDAETEAHLVDAFRTSLAGRTVLIASHRVSIALECDLVLMLDGGRNVEFGPPAKLLDQAGAFAALCELESQRTRLGDFIA